MLLTAILSELTVSVSTYAQYTSSERMSLLRLAGVALTTTRAPATAFRAKRAAALKVPRFSCTLPAWPRGILPAPMSTPK